MLSRIAVVCSLGVIVGATPLLAASIPCQSSTTNECTTAPTCQADGSCQGEPTREGQPCTQDVSGGCMTNAVCQQGVCTGTVPAADGTPCTYPGLGNCYTGSRCQTIAGIISFCTLGTPKSCPGSSDPCKQSFCNPQTGNCQEGDKCFTFSGCEVCNAGTCQAVNIGGPCANPEGDFNECTTNDRCSLLSLADSSPELGPAATSSLPPAVAAAMYDARQVGTMRGICQGVPGVGPTPTATTVVPTPTVGPSSCVGDCSGNNEVTVDELILMVNVALGNTQVSACTPGDVNQDGEITVNEIVAAVNAALNGCPS
jgi:hypothetical protein